MKKAAFVLACLSNGCDGRRIQPTASGTAPTVTSQAKAEIDATNPLTKFAALLAAFQSAPAAFALSRSVHSVTDKTSRGQRTVSMKEAPSAQRVPRRQLATGLAAAAVALQAPALIPADAPLLSRIASSQIVQAKDRASASGSRVNKDPDSLLRLGLPKQNKEMREMQAGLEECEDNLKRTLSIQAKGGLDKSERILAGNVDKFLNTLNSGDTEKGKELLRALKDSIALVKANLDRNPDEALVDNRKALDTISRFQELTALTYTQPEPPKDLRSTLPYLKGRGEVDFVITRPGGEFNVNRKSYAKIELTMTLDGYTAPVTAGNLMDLVNKGFYNGMTIQRSDGFVVQTGDPGAEKGKNPDIHGYVPAGKQKVRNVPLEIYVAGDKEPIYGATLDEDGRGGYATALPFNAYGALGMAREEYNIESASSQFFWLLFDSDLTPAGKNMLDGSYTCFGYTTRNAELLADVKEGDVIESAKVRSGLQNLVQPA